MHYRYLLYISLILLSCQKEANEKQNSLIRPVRAIKVEALGTIDKSYTGVVEAEQFSILAFKIPGALTSMNVSEGQVIPKGYLIARIDPLDYQLKYETAQSQFNTAKSIYERTDRLLALNAIALQNLEIAKADYVQATSAVNIAESTLGYADLRAPFRGLIEKKYVENFQKVMAGEAVVRLVNPDEINIRFILPETNIDLIRAPKNIYVQFDTQKNKWFKAIVKEYIYSSDGSGIPVTLRITDPGFKPFRQEVYPGFSCKVLFKIENTVSDKYVIPASALFTENKNDYLWIVNPGTNTVSRQEVAVRRFDDKALVEKGLNKEDIIVTAGVKDIKEGQKVSVTLTNQ